MKKRNDVWMCQISEILDSRVVDLLCLTARAVRHIHPKRQPNLTHCAGYRASAMRDRAAASQTANALLLSPAPISTKNPRKRNSKPTYKSKSEADNGG